MESTSLAHRERPRPALLLAAVVIVICAAYAPVLGGPFIWDDHHLLASLPSADAPLTLRGLLGSAFWQRDDFDPAGATYYRPLTILSLALDRAVHGNNPSGYHLTNLAFHALNAGLLFALIRGLGVRSLTAAVAVLLWGLHPRLTEAAAWVSGRTDVLATTCVLAALLVARNEGGWRRAAAAVLLLLGLGFKEVALAGLVALIALELRRGRSQRWASRIARLAPFVACGAGYAALRISAVGAALPQDMTGSERALAALEAVGRYAWMLLNPWQPNISLGQLQRPALPFVIGGGAVLVLLALLGWRKRRALPTEQLALWTAFAASFFLVLHVLPIAVRVVAADRFLYLPLAMLAAALAPAAESIARSRRVMPLAAAALAASFAMFTWRRADQWADEIRFWVTAYHQQETDNAVSRVELGNVYYRAGLSGEAIAIYRNTDEPEHRYRRMATNNLAVALFTTGRYQEALRLFAQLTQREPTVPRFWLNRALVNIARFRFDAAERQLKRAVELYPTFREPQAVLNKLPQLREWAAALRPLESSAPEQRLDFGNRAAHLQRFPDALDSWRRAFEAGHGSERDARRALLLALEVGESDHLRALSAAYRRIAGRAASPDLLTNVELRTEQVARLRELWPSLGLRRAEAGPPDPFPEPPK